MINQVLQKLIDCDSLSESEKGRKQAEKGLQDTQAEGSPIPLCHGDLTAFGHVLVKIRRIACRTAHRKSRHHFQSEGENAEIHVDGSRYGMVVNAGMVLA
jgi:hypothetical protein